ncbi:MAG: ATP-binding cassette domain-containing protein [Pseudomonadota bacterium]|nr:ATP-binding cassette domain-containing protein [Pseudomonadota bacterium]
MSTPLLHVDRLTKRYTRGLLRPQTTFSLEADFTIDGPGVIGVMGPNGSGKTTLFELITGGNVPTTGRVLVAGQDIHAVRYGQRDRVAIHYHQSYQLRSFKRTRPEALMARAASDSPCVHLFDEPQFNTQDGYIGFMLDFFKKLRAADRLVFVCLHPNEPYHLDILRESCERFIFVDRGRLTHAPSWQQLEADDRVRTYLGRLASAPAERTATAAAP